MTVLRNLGVLLLLAVSACAFNRGTLGDDIKPDVVNSIKKSTTTKTEVLALLGAPDRILQVNGRDVFQYYRYDAKAGSLLLIILNFLAFPSRVTICSSCSTARVSSRT